MSLSDPNQVFVLTHDIDEKVQNFTQAGIKVPDLKSNFYSDIHTDMASELQQALPENVVVKSIGMLQLARDILTVAVDIAEDEDLIVSTCPEIANSARGMTLELNRIVDFNGAPLGLGPRAGMQTIHEQILKLKRAAAGRPVVIVEDGIFHGETMEYVVEQLHKNQVTIKAIVAGFTFPASDGIRDKIIGQGIIFKSVEEFNNLFEWVPDHDFMPFLPSCGKLVGFKYRDICFPFYTAEQASYSIPYLYGFCPMKDWVSLEEDVSKVFTTKCIGYTVELFRELERLNPGRDIVYHDLLHTKHRVSLPVSITQTTLPSPSVRALDYLSEIL